GTDYFGTSVAISGLTAVVSAPYRNNSTGAAYVFANSGGTCTQQAEFLASDAATEDFFGWSVALSGSTAVVGAPKHDQGDQDTGVAYVFTGSAGIWTQRAELTASDWARSDRFGNSVALSRSTLV